ncbi:MAG: translation initiation factor IF-2 [Nitrospirae bacterium]|nr:translation initiation factor IF-2 [Nitrospirota bacterium]
MKVSELAKKIKVGTKELLAELKALGSRAASPSSSVEESAVKQVLERYKKAATPAKPEKKTVAPAASTKTKPSKAASAAKPSKTAVPAKKAVKPAPKIVKLKKTEPAPAPEPERKTRILIKKKAEPIPEPVVAAPSLSPLPEAQAVVGPSTTAAHSAEPVTAAIPAAGAAPQPVSEGVPSVVPGKEAPASPAAPPAKHKLLKTDLFELAKQELSDRLKQRGKKAKKSKKTKENPLADYQYELSSWRDIRPAGHRDEKSRRMSAPAGVAEITKPRKKMIKLSEGLTVKDYAELIGQKSTEVIRKLMEMGTMAAINQPMDLSAGVLIAEGYGLKAEVVQGQTEEYLLSGDDGAPEADALDSRSPVVTIMGHVDHGKTSLLDAIRSTKVAAGEAGGITQHIGAYTVKVGDRKITFLDTPGHEAFTAMRARGAKVTDIVVLVVAADDGVMPQTIEAINHARAANVPIIVAINKIDKPEANSERVKSALAEHNLMSEAWGGQSIFVEVSAKKKLNLDALLEMILLQADVLELKADPKRLAKGIVIEAKMDKGRGPVATVLVQSGTLNIGDAFVTGTFFGRVRALIDDEGKKVPSAGPSQPVEVIGMPGVPQAGDTFVAVREERVAREIATDRLQKERTAKLALQHRVTLEDLYNRIKEGTLKELNLVLRADVQGSVEALTESLTKLSTPAVKLNVIHGGVGGITETDVLLASASNATIIGFNVRPETKAAAVAEREKVDVRSYTIIYDAIGDIRAAMEGLLDPTLKERVTGRVEVRQVFNITKVGTIAGAYVTEGMISRVGAGVRVLRDNVVIYTGKLSSLKRFKDDVREVQTGYECGLGVENFNDIKVGDVIEAFVVDKIAAKL